MFEYRNDFLYIVLKSSSQNRFIYCSGVNITRFLPLTKGRHRLGQNPVEKGLQSVNNEVKSLLISEGASIKTPVGNLCPEIRKDGKDLWYTESFYIKGLDTIEFNKIAWYVVLHLLKKIYLAMMLDEKPPEMPLPPEELQEYLDRLCNKYNIDMLKN